jgi:hypothetical protein
MPITAIQSTQSKEEAAWFVIVVWACGIYYEPAWHGFGEFAPWEDLLADPETP